MGQTYNRQKDMSLRLFVSLVKFDKHLCRNSI